MEALIDLITNFFNQIALWLQEFFVWLEGILTSM
jgi:hypothetical protein